MAEPRRRFAALIGVALLASLMAACSSGGGHPSAVPPAGTSTSAPPAGTPAAASPSAVQWVPCRGGAGPSRYQCATVQVPRNPSAPNGQTIGMAIDRHRATGPKVGSLLVNPGGPGASGVDALPELVAEMPSDLLAHFDIVGFDPPGVGRTAPITCLNSSALYQYFHVDPEPTTASGFDALVAEDKTFADGCEAESGAELPYVGTVDAARDMDVLRAALGDSQLNYLGFSYGTFLGATYAGLFPTHVRAMVLDGALDPALPVVTQLDEQSASLEGQLQQYFSSCTSDPSCPWKPGPDPVAAYEGLLARVQARPLPASGTNRTVGPSELLYGTAVTLYSTTTWDDLSTALAEASQGNGTALLELFDAYTGRGANGSYNNLFEANAAIDCLDAPAPTLTELQADAPAAEVAAPIFGLQNLYSEAGCSVWPAPATGKVGPIAANGSPPIVVVGSTGDPITPYSWAEALASQLSRGVLLTRVGDGHTGYGSSSCIRSYVDRYLIGLTVPPAGTRCPSD